MKGMQIENIYQKMWCEYFSTKTKFEYNIFFIYSKTCSTYCIIFVPFQVEGKVGLEKLLEKCLWLEQKKKKPKKRRREETRHRKQLNIQ